MSKFLPLSFIAEYEYCPRSAFYLLTDTPSLRGENVYIQDGRKVHKIVDEKYIRSRGMKKIESSVRIFSEKYHISGKIDVVEFLKNGEIVPVEFKRGKSRKSSMHQMQLALSALCLQEMFPECDIKKGAVFFAENRKKIEVKIDNKLQKKAKNLAEKVWLSAKNGLIPKNFPTQKDTRCEGCCFSLLCFE